MWPLREVQISGIEKESATFSLPRAILDIRIFVEERREKLIKLCTVSETLFLLT
jgi:hypothetical protein